MRRDLVICVLLVAATLAVYGQAARHDFVNFDDNEYVYENPRVKAGLTWGGVAWAFTTMRESNWHPLTWLSHMLDCQLFGVNAGYHHLANVFLHILNSVLLYALLKLMTDAPWRSAMVAALFALHPLHVESVAWISERKDVLSTLFFMLTLWAYAWYAAQPSWHLYGLVFAFLALGLMAKPMLVTVPFVLLLLDYWPLGRFRPKEETGAPGTRGTSHRGEGAPGASVTRLLVEKAPLFALVAASSVITFLAQQRGGSTAPTDVVPLDLRAANALVSYGAYVGKMLWPRDLAFFYPYRDSVTTAEWLGSALLLAGVSVLIIRTSRRWRYLAVGWFWYLGMLVPVIGLVQVGRQSMADRYTYLPLIGLFLMGVWGTADLAARYRRGRTLLAAAAGGVLLVCMVAAWVRVGHWRDGITLFEQALRVTEGNALAHNNLGLALQERGSTEEAIRHYREALRIDPALHNAHGNLGNALLRQGKRAEGMKHYEEALRINPASARAHNNLGNEWMARGETEKAIPHYEEALRIKPEQAATHSNLGNALMAEGRQEEAIPHYQEALRIDPEFADAHNNLGLALARQGKRDDAIAHFREALRLEPDYADGHYNLGLVWAGQGRLEEARHHYRQAVRIDPRYTKAHYELGVVSLKQGRQDEAIAHFRRTLVLDAENPEAHRNLAMALADQGKHEETIEHYREAIRLRPNDPSSYNNLAWIRATHPDPKLRNGTEAVELAEKACQLWGRGEVDLLDTLAAAFAEAGRFPEAVATLEEAISLAASAGLEEKKEELGRRLLGYRAGHPYREAQTDDDPGEP